MRHRSTSTSGRFPSHRKRQEGAVAESKESIPVYSTKTAKVKEETNGEMDGWQTIAATIKRGGSTGKEWENFVCRHPSVCISTDKSPLPSEEKRTGPMVSREGEVLLAEAGGGGDCLWHSIKWILRCANVCGEGNNHHITMENLRRLNARAFRHRYLVGTSAGEFWDVMETLRETLSKGEDPGLARIIHFHRRRAMSSGVDIRVEREALVAALASRIAVPGGWWGDELLLGLLAETKFFANHSLGIITFTLPQPGVSASHFKVNVFSCSSRGYMNKEEKKEEEKPCRYAILYNNRGMHWQPLGVRRKGFVQVLFHPTEVPDFIQSHPVFQSSFGCGVVTSVTKVMEEKKKKKQVIPSELDHAKECAVGLIVSTLRHLRLDIVSQPKSTGYRHTLDMIYSAFDLLMQLDSRHKAVPEEHTPTRVNPLTKKQTHDLYAELSALARETSLPHVDLDHLFQLFSVAIGCNESPTKV